MNRDPFHFALPSIPRLEAFKFDPEEFKSPFLAARYFEELQKRIREFEKRLKDDEQLSVLCFTPDGSRIDIQRFRAGESYMLTLEGYMYDRVSNCPGQTAQVITSYHSLQLFLTAQKVEKGKPKRRIGFEQHRAEEKQGSPE